MLYTQGYCKSYLGFKKRDDANQATFPHFPFLSLSYADYNEIWVTREQNDLHDDVDLHFIIIGGNWEICFIIFTVNVNYATMETSSDKWYVDLHSACKDIPCEFALLKCRPIIWRIKIKQLWVIISTIFTYPNKNNKSHYV